MWIIVDFPQLQMFRRTESMLRVNPHEVKGATSAAVFLLRSAAKSGDGTIGQGKDG